MTLSARATDSKGLVTTAQPITLNVVADTIAPTIVLLDPQAGASVRERSFVSVVVDAQDNVAVSVVEILVNDQVVQTGGAGEIFSVEIPSGIASATFGARARDAAGNVGVAATITLPVIPDVPPSVRILTPTTGELAIERTAVRVNVEASDDVLLTELAVLVNGQVVRTLSSPFGLHPPYRFKVRVPTGVTSFALSVRATDNVGQTYTTSDVVLAVAPDVGTTVTGRVVDQANTSVANATIVCLGVSGLSGADGTFALTGVPSLQGAVSCVANGVVTGGGTAGGTSVSRLPVHGGSITVGDIVLVGATTAPLYTATPSIGLSSFPNAVASGDLNQDGKVDLVLGEGGVRILLGNGDGTVQAGQTFSAGGGDVRGVTVADVNRDGVPDIVTANGSAKNVGVLLGNGDGTLQAPRTLSTRGVNVADVAVGDLDGDGNPDIVSANDVLVGFFSPGDVTVFLGNGDGTFRALDSLYAGFMPHRVILRDVDVDGILDMLVLERQGLSSGGKVWVLIGQGDGTFAAPQTFAAGNDASGMAVSDFNQDGNLDVVVTNRTTGDLSLLLGNGDGTFQPEQRIFEGGTPQGVIVNDVNFDGDADLAVFDFSVSLVRLLLGRGDGTFPASDQIPLLGSGTEAFTTGDLNGDNLPDLVVIRRNLFAGSSTIEVLLHR